MTIFVDADACPKQLKEILFKAAKRTSTALILVANQTIAVPRSEYIRSVTVASGLDVADQYIVEQVAPGDLVITSDIPLADLVIAKGATVLNGKGEMLTEDNIKSRLSTRNLMDELRGAGIVTGGPSSLHARDIQQFANALDRYITGAIR